MANGSPNNIYSLQPLTPRKILTLAQDNSFTPEMMAKLQQHAQFIIPACKAVSMFSKFPGPDARYFSDWVKLTLRFDRKDGCPIFTFAFIILANVENNDATYAGFPVRIQFYCRAGKNSSTQEAWDRLFTQGFQAMGVTTSKWQNPNQDMLVAANWLNTEKFPVVLSVVTGPQYQNFNIVEVLNRDAIKGLTRPAIQITDEQIDADGPEFLDETDVTDDFAKKFKEAEEHLLTMSYPELVAQCSASSVEIEDIASKTDIQLRRALLRFLVLNADRDPADFGFSDEMEAEPGRTTEELHLDKGGNLRTEDGKIVESPPFDTGSALADALGEEEDDDEPIIEVIIPIKHQAEQLVTVMTREQCKQALHQKYQVSKFSKSMTDDVIRQMLLDAAVAANEIRWTI